VVIHGRTTVDEEWSSGTEGHPALQGRTRQRWQDLSVVWDLLQGRRDRLPFHRAKNQTACMRICLNLFFHFSSHFLHLFFNIHLSSFIDFPFLHFFTTILHPILWWESLPFLTFPFSASSQHVTILNPGYELHATV
jgi:hypothetical protein